MLHGSSPDFDSDGGVPDETLALAKRRLDLICEALNEPNDFFAARARSGQPAWSGPSADAAAAVLQSDDGARLIDSFRTIRDPAIRRHVVDLLNCLAGRTSMSVWQL